jgi:hypothetical protein
MIKIIVKILRIFYRIIGIENKVFPHPLPKRRGLLFEKTFLNPSQPPFGKGRG